MTGDDLRIRKTSVTLADGRELMYFGAIPERPAGYPDRRQLAAVHVQSQARWDRLLGEWVVIASHRQDRTFQPADDQCPLCPSTAGSRTEIPAPEYEVVVFENRFPTLKTAQADTGSGDGADPAAENPVAGPGPPAAGPGRLLAGRPAAGRCEVVCFSQHHTASFADLSPGQAAIVMAAWADRSAELARLPGVEQVYCFENRGAEIGVTLSHPHGQIYAYPYITPRTDRMLASCASYRRETGSNLFDDMLAAEEADSSRIVLRGSHWTAFVPYAARWPYEVHLYPTPPGARPGGAGGRGERRVLRALPRPAAPVRPALRPPGALHLGLASGAGPPRRRRFRPAPGAVHRQARAGQAEVPGRVGVGHGRIRQRHHP
jgi:UDPglucose--hexose-1-phosphate uridylyltransferase